MPGEATGSMVEALDLFPTLTDLVGLPKPDFVDGVSLRSERASTAAVSSRNAERATATVS